MGVHFHFLLMGTFPTMGMGTRLIWEWAGCENGYIFTGMGTFLLWKWVHFKWRNGYISTVGMGTFPLWEWVHCQTQTKYCNSVLGFERGTSDSEVETSTGRPNRSAEKPRKNLTYKYLHHHFESVKFKQNIVIVLARI